MASGLLLYSTFSDHRSDKEASQFVDLRSVLFASGGVVQGTEINQGARKRSDPLRDILTA